MGSDKGSVHRLVSRMGTAAFVAWVLAIGPLGAFAFVGLYYSMLVKSLPLGVICAAVLFSPVVLTLVWIPLALMAFRRGGEEATVEVGRRAAAQTRA